MKKLVILSALALAAWLAAGVGWSTAASLTGLPGPTLAAQVSTDAATAALEAVDLPRPLDRARCLLARQVRLGGRAVVRLYAVPERIADRLVDRLEDVTEREAAELWAAPDLLRAAAPLPRG